MRIINKILFTFLLMILTHLLYGSSTSKDSLIYEVLLSENMANNILPNEKFINSIDITSNHLILLSTNNQYYLLGWGGIIPLGKKVTGRIGSYSYTSDSLLMTIRNNELCVFDLQGNLSKLYTLPSTGMGISGGKYGMYVFDRNGEKQKQALFVLVKGGKYSKLFEIPTPIQSVVEMNNSILFATQNTLFCYDLYSKGLKALVALSNGQEIKSLAFDTSSSRIYFSTSSMIYAIKDSSAALVTDKFGGILRFFNDGLIVFNPEKKFLIRIVGLEGKIASIKQPMKTAANDKQILAALTNTSIIDMVKQKLSDGLIINMINRSRVDFNLSVDSMIYLSSQNVSSAVIMAMKNAMKRKTSNVSNDGNR